MNHLGDTNKMVETPRTDAAEKHAYQFKDEWTPVCESKLVRQLERELNAANDRIKRLESGDAALTYSIGLDLQKENNSLKDRIKRLEDALTSIGEYWNRDTNERAMEDACWYAVNTAADALEAKEDKP